MSESHTFKILTLGESGVGKTCILRRFVEGQFNKNYLATIGIDFKTKNITIGETVIRLKIWDTAGQDRFRNITRQYYKEADGILLVFDLSDNHSYENINYWIDQITQNTEADQIGLVLVGNKADIDSREITTEMGNELAMKYSLNYYETSALNGSNITECIECLTKEIINKQKIEVFPTDNTKKSTAHVLLDDGKNKKSKEKKNCCE